MFQINSLIANTELFAEWVKSHLGKPFFGFSGGHAYLSKEDLDRIESNVGDENHDHVRRFESQFSSMIGEGAAVSFASARMGMFALMKIIGVRHNDDVIVTGATCSVVINAIKRLGANPIYADIDCDTLGSSVAAIQKVLTVKTRLIIAQHTFGIPCDILSIAALAREHGIFLLEDCALTVGSKLDGIVCGNFGDAAVFSTDHTKPLNTMIGGLVYTSDEQLLNQLRIDQNSSPNLSQPKQRAIWNQLLFERQYSHHAKYGRQALIYKFKRRFRNLDTPFLEDDYRPNGESSYPYPAKMPSFLAVLGIFELQRWPIAVRDRCEFLSVFLGSMERSNMLQHLPSSYFDERKNIIPLRIAWAQRDGDKLREKISKFIDIAGIWFAQPIEAAAEPLVKYGYTPGTCANSERMGPLMINLPCIMERDGQELFFYRFKKALQYAGSN